MVDYKAMGRVLITKTIKLNDVSNPEQAIEILDDLIVGITSNALNIYAHHPIEVSALRAKQLKKPKVS